MATSLDTPPPNETNLVGGSSSSPLYSPSSDKRFWSTLRGRVDSLLDPKISDSPNNTRTKHERGNRLKEDSLLLMRGFDSVSHTLSLLSNNLDNALQGARELGHAPTLTDIFQSKIDKEENKQEEKEKEKEKEKEEESSKQGIKRKLDDDDDDEVDSTEENAAVDDGKNGQKMPDKHIKKAKNLAVSMATKATSLARELKSIKSDLCFMQDRCNLLEEENRRLRDGFAKGIRPEEDDLVRLQLEALLNEKSRLANENANLVRENQCLHQLVEYHQLASQEESYDHVIQGMQLDFSSIAEEEEEEEEESQTPRNNIFKFSEEEEESQKE